MVSTREQMATLNFTARQAQCLTLYCCEGLSQQRIAERLGIAQRVVSQHIAAARKKIEQRGLAQPGAYRDRRSESITMTPMTAECMDPAEIRYIW